MIFCCCFDLLKLKEWLAEWLKLSDQYKIFLNIEKNKDVIDQSQLEMKKKFSWHQLTCMDR